MGTLRGRAMLCSNHLNARYGSCLIAHIVYIQYIPESQHTIFSWVCVLHHCVWFLIKIGYEELEKQVFTIVVVLMDNITSFVHLLDLSKQILQTVQWEIDLRHFILLTTAFCEGIHKQHHDHLLVQFIYIYLMNASCL